jgi:hypothetical protein
VIEAKCKRGSDGILAETLDRLLARERPSRAIRVPLSCVHRMMGHLGRYSGISSPYSALAVVF